MPKLKTLGEQSVRIALSLLVTLLFCVSGAFAATTNNDNNDNQHNGGIWDGGGTIYHPGHGGVSGDTGASGPKSGVTASTDTTSAHTGSATTGMHSNAATYRRPTPKPGTTGSAIGTKKQAGIPGKVQTTRQPSWGDDQPVPANSYQGKFIVKTVHHKKTAHKKARQSPSLKRGLKYLKKRWKHYDKKMPKFPNDCTNFASQYMVARGYKKTQPGGRKYWIKGQNYDKKKWYCKKKKNWGKLFEADVSSSWDTVEGFWTHWTKVKKLKHQTMSKQKIVRKKVKVGDIIQFKSKNAGWFHTAIVTKKTKHDVFYASHTANHLHKGLRNCNKGKARRGKNKIIKYRIIHVNKRK